MTPSRRSLFWAIAGTFLVTGLAGVLAQGLVAVAVLRPLEVREARSRAELVASSLAAALTSSPSLVESDRLDTLLARHRDRLGVRRSWIAYRAPGGRVVTAPPGRERFLARLGSRAGAEPVTTVEERRGRGPDDLVEVVARHPLTRGAAAGGELIVVRPVWPRGGLDFLGSRTFLLFLPVSVIASVVAGLIMVRMLVRRLRALETLATRVAEGDLSVRVDDRSGDEIGRLAERLNRMTERLAGAREQVESTERQRRQLFADITHELATPLTSIRGYAETLEDPAVPLSGEERSRYVRGIREESRRLDRLIRDLFELARLEAGATPLAKEPLDWVDLCRNTLRRFEPRFRAAGIALDWRGPVAPARIDADGRRLEQVLENLLTNALRYVPSGGAVDVSVLPAPSGNGGYRMTVRDDGPGIAADELPLVFRRFYRGTESGDGRGSGLGLAIVREIVEQHGGTVRAEGRDPHGLIVSIDLPAGSPQPSEAR